MVFNIYIGDGFQAKNLVMLGGYSSTCYKQDFSCFMDTSSHLRTSLSDFLCEIQNSS